MPKDPTRNVDRSKIRGGALNEFEFHEGQEALAEQKEETTKATKGTKKVATRGASAKKLAARKAEKK